MSQSFAMPKGATLIALVFLFLALGTGEGWAFASSSSAGPHLSTGLIASPESPSLPSPTTRIPPLLSGDQSPLSFAGMEVAHSDEPGEGICHHAYEGPLPSWECQHPDSAFSLSPHLAPDALPESGAPVTTPGAMPALSTKILPSASPFRISPKLPPRPPFSL